ncbi:hypothetical protein ACFYUK_15085 [Nonomuraea wenchangensis]
MRLLLRSALAGVAVAFALLLLLHWPTRDSDSELRLLSAFALAPFPLSMAAAWLARLPVWPLVGLLAVPATAGFMATALLCAWLFREPRATG